MSLKCTFLWSSLLAAPLTHAALFNNGALNVIDFATSDFFDVANSIEGDPTTLSIETGATITGDDGLDNSVYAFDDSIIIVNGGTLFDDIALDDNSQLTMNGGTLEDDIFAFANSTATINGGIVEEEIIVEEQARLFISGGSVGKDIQFFDNAEGHISGGIFSEDIEIFSGSLRIDGGSFVDVLDPGYETGLGVGEFGTIILAGSNFMVDGEAVADGEIGAAGGILSGTLADGSLLNIVFDRGLDGNGTFGTIILTTVPEPSTFILPFLIFAGVYLRSKFRRSGHTSA